MNALHRLEACNANACAASSAVSATNLMLETIGYFKASNNRPFAGFWDFGLVLALSANGNTLAVSAPFESSDAINVNGDQDNSFAQGSGAVYIFARAGSGWTQQADVKASNTDQFDRFGNSLALSADGNTLAVAALLEDSAATGVGGDEDDDSAAEAGAVYVFTRSGST